MVYRIWTWLEGTLVKSTGLLHPWQILVALWISRQLCTIQITSCFLLAIWRGIKLFRPSPSVFHPKNKHGLFDNLVKVACLLPKDTYPMTTNDVVKSPCVAFYFSKRMTRRVAMQYFTIQRIYLSNYKGLLQKM